jgi:hypothetical protein
MRHGDRRALVRAPDLGCRLRGPARRTQVEWRVWKDVRLPEGKVLIPGVIAPTTAVVEHLEMVADAS